MQFNWKLAALTGVAMQLLTYAHAQQQPAPAETARFSAQQAVEYALANQYAVRTAKLDELITIARNREVSGLALPQVSGTGNFMHSPVLQKQQFNFGNFTGKDSIATISFQLPYNAQGYISINQVLFDPSVLVALQARKTLEELAQKGVKKSEVDVREQVYKAYYNVVAADKALVILRESVVRLENTLRETREIYKNGLVEKLDVDRLVVQYNNLKSEEVRLRNLREVGLSALKFQIGMPMRQPLELTDTLSNSALKADIQEDRNFSYSNRIEYQLLESQKKANEYNLKRYKLQGMPTLALFGQGGTLRGSEKFDYFKSQMWYGYFQYGLNLSVPIFTGFQRKRKVDQAFLEVKKSDLDIENVRNAIDLEQSTSTANLRNNITTLENQEENMALAQDVYNTSMIKYREGVGSSLEMITAETQLLTAQNSYFNALFNVIVARIDYMKAYGKL
ncbi:TolC family protein [Chitinophaga lutea]